MSIDSPWRDEIQKVVADRAYSLNYEDGVQCRFLSPRSEEGTHTIEILLETTHSGHPFDLRWFVRHTDELAHGVQFEVVAPADEGGTLWQERCGSAAKLRASAQMILPFIRGYFVGRESASAARQMAEKTD